MDLGLGQHQERMEPLIVNLGNETEMLIGIDWLEVHNPSIDWRSGEVKFNRCPPECKVRHGTFSIKKVAPTEPSKDDKDDNGVWKGIKPDYVKNYGPLFEKKNFDKLPK